MLIGGFQKTSLIDYPGKVCAIIFTAGCSFRCGYCHNPELVYPDKFPKRIPAKDIFQFLKKRQKKIDAVTITGGEPTLQPDLVDFMRSIKKLGFLIKLDSNGTLPQVLKKIIDNKLVDYIAMDIKAPLEKYSQVTYTNVDTINIRHSIELIMNSDVPYEFRTTIVKSQLSQNDLIGIGKMIKGAQLYALQKFIPTKTNKKEFLKEKTYSDKEFTLIQAALKPYVVKCIVR